MFRRTRNKIVLLIMTVSILLLSSILCIIYIASAGEVRERNHRLLEHYIENYAQLGKTNSLPGNELPERGTKGLPDKPVRMYELSTFYSVYYDYGQNTVEIDNRSNSLYSDEQVRQFAEEILARGKRFGTYGSFYFLLDEAQDATLVAFLDDTLGNDSFDTMIKYTLIFGGAALLVIFVLSFLLARKLIRPMEMNDRKQKQFISDAGHELKTPLAVIGTNIDMISREYGESKWVHNIYHEINRMAALIKDLMILSRSENAIVPMAPVDFGRVVLGECLSFEVAAFENGRRLNYDAVECGLVVMGNENQLGQLASVLLDNAIEHSDKPDDILVTLSKIKNRASFAVTNHAEPIPEGERARIFDRFYRRDHSRSGENNHYGLGLSIAKAIVSSHRGEMNVRYEDGRITFTVEIPIDKAKKDFEGSI